MLRRRQLILCLFFFIVGTLGHIGSAASADSAQQSSQWQPGVHYKVLSPTLPTDAKAGRIVVTEFFWFGCKHCYALEAPLADWLKNRPDYIDFERIPVAWGKAQEPAHARLYYALLQLDREDLVPKVFHELHKNDGTTKQPENPLYAPNNPAETLRLQQEFAAANGIPKDKFIEAYNSGAVQLKVDQANQAARSIKLEGVPTIIVAGKYSTGVHPAGGPEKLFALVNYLAGQEIAETASR